MMIRISEGPTAANRHEARIPDLRKDYWLGAPSACVRPTRGRLGGQAASSTVASLQHQGGSSVSCGLARHPPPCTRRFRAFTLRGADVRETYVLLMIPGTREYGGRPEIQTAAGRMWPAGGGGMVHRG